MLGFKDFIELAEKDRLEMLINESPQYFFNVLPYAYVFGISDEWAKQFESFAIENPNWYVAPHGYTHHSHILKTTSFISSIDSSLNTVYTRMVPKTSRSSGRFSSGGGGGGGGGGGSW